MPTEREHSKYNPDEPDFKVDNSKFRPAWLQNLQLNVRHNYITAWLSPGDCKVCFSIRIVISLLAIYGVVNLLS